MSLLSKLHINTHSRFRLALRGGALFVGLFAAFIVSVLMENHAFWWALLVFIPVLCAAGLEFILADVLADRSFPFETERKLAWMEERLGAGTIVEICNRLRRAIGQLKACDQSRVSATVHILIELSASTHNQIRSGLLQLTDYVGPDGGKKGRITLINQGVIGRCARTHRTETVDFADAEEYEDLMVRDFGFTKTDTDRHTKTGRSYLAQPLFNGDSFVGVLYFFTTEPQVFPLAARDIDLESLVREVVSYLRIAQLV